MAAMIDDSYVVDRADSVELAKTVIDALESENGELYNKYLYLGPHGAYAWEQVESAGTFEIKMRARKLLRQHFPAILELILADNGGKGLDVVSLGTGTGRDDTYILEELWRRQKEGVSLFAVDLAGDLLRRAIRSIRDSYKRDQGRSEKTALHAMCIDIAKLATHRDLFGEKTGDDKQRLFHLLGLTLGNNDEFNFLSQIANCMKPDDYLLIDVDFCLDQKEWKEASIGSYDHSDLVVNQFVSTPLKTAIALANRHPDLLEFDGMFRTPAGDQCNYLKDPFQILKKPILDAANQPVPLSRVPGAMSLARFYVPERIVAEFDAADPQRRRHGKLCDFSNKYKSEQFAAWIETHGEELGLQLMTPNNCKRAWGGKLGWEDGQYLLLFKKMPDAPPQTIVEFCEQVTEGLDKIFDANASNRIGSRARNIQKYFIKNEANIKRIEMKYDSETFELPDVSEAVANEDVAKEYINKVESLTRLEAGTHGIQRR